MTWWPSNLFWRNSTTTKNNIDNDVKEPLIQEVTPLSDGTPVAQSPSRTHRTKKQKIAAGVASGVAQALRVSSYQSPLRKNPHKSDSSNASSSKVARHDITEEGLADMLGYRYYL